MSVNFDKISKWLTDNLGGLLAVIAGLVLLSFTYKIIINLVLFFVGFFLIYFGLVKLKVTVVTDFVDNMIKKLKKVMS
ncbi:hypothetical protein K9L05_04105 [Candidatus Babeliales bacterium]|nr:hypothetical protein [Candidatus Babeliales bacterium]MCF7899799.1 hypothetical protein [Candidatus Babeliales bacterium]